MTPRHRCAVYLCLWFVIGLVRRLVVSILTVAAPPTVSVSCEWKTTKKTSHRSFHLHRPTLKPVCHSQGRSRGHALGLAKRLKCHLSQDAPRMGPTLCPHTSPVKSQLQAPRRQSTQSWSLRAPQCLRLQAGSPADVRCLGHRVAFLSSSQSLLFFVDIAYLDGILAI